MTRYSRYVSWLVILVFWSVACTEEEPYIMEDYIDIDLIPYFQSFETEAAMRGVSIDFSNSGITALFDQIEGSIAGQCTSDETGLREIRVDYGYWRRSTTYEKEYVIFHELGHCYLGRSHVDESDNSGACLSLMNSGLGYCRNDYGRYTRSDYLDELFAQ